MLIEDIEHLVDSLQKDFVSKLKYNVSNIEERLTRSKSPFDTFGANFNSSRERILFRSDKPMSNLDYCENPKDLADVIQAVKYALNNNTGYDRYKSYTLSLPIALFKYNAKQLSVMKANVNCIMLSLKINGFSWIDMDDDGNRYFQGDVNVFIPLRLIFNKEACKYIIIRELKNIDVYTDGHLFEDMYDLDGIDNWEISGFVIDVSTIGKNELHNVVNATKDLFDSGLKPVVSHLTDKECVAYIGDTLTDVDIREKTEFRSKVVDCIKIYYLLRIIGRDFGAKYYKEFVLQKYDYAYEIFEYIDIYLAYANIYEEYKFMDDFFSKKKINFTTVDGMMKECLDHKLIGVEAYSLYNTHIKGREY